MFGRIAAEVGVKEAQVAAVARLLGEGNTVPFIARYRKEAHGNLDEVQILKVQERIAYYTELKDRKAAILKSPRPTSRRRPSICARASRPAW